MAKRRDKRVYTTVGFVVTKFGLPIAKRMLKRKGKSIVANTTRRGRAAERARSGKGKIGVALGAAAGALAYVVSRHARSGDAD